MFGDNKSEAIDLHSVSDDNISTILDKHSTFEGKMTFEGTVVINGKFVGEIFSEGNLIIGQGGLVEGQIEVGQIQIQGEVRGNIKATKRIEINAPAIVNGDINAPSLIIKEGAVFDGNCSMGDKVQTQNVVDFSDHNRE